jgi:hypothetical protein
MLHVAGILHMHKYKVAGAQERRRANRNVVPVRERETARKSGESKDEEGKELAIVTDHHRSTAKAARRTVGRTSKKKKRAKQWAPDEAASP